MGRQTFEPKAQSEAATTSSTHVAEQRLFIGHQESRNVFLHGEVNECSVANVIAQMLSLAECDKRPIYLVVSTYGGSVDEMFSLYDTIKFLPCPVHTVGLGKVMSAGVLLLASGTRGKRMMGARARIMMHSTSGDLNGNVFEVENEANEHRRLHDLMVERLVAETRMTRRQVTKIMDSKVNRYLTPEEALRLGIVDKIIGIT